MYTQPQLFINLNITQEGLILRRYLLVFERLSLYKYTNSEVPPNRPSSGPTQTRCWLEMDLNSNT